MMRFPETATWARKWFDSRPPHILLIMLCLLFLVGCSVEDEEKSNTGQVAGTTGGVKTYSTQIRIADGRIVTCIIARDAKDSANLSGKGVGVGISCDWAKTK